MTLFLPGMDDGLVASAIVAGDITTARSWCDPSAYREIVGIDFGSNAVHYYMARSGTSGSVGFSSFKAWLVGLQPGTLALCEWAHLAVPQTSRSLAQPYTAAELLEIYSLCQQRGVTLKLAPHAHTGMRMRLWVSNRHPELIKDSEKTDSADAIALAIFVSECNEVSLANPPATFEVSPARAYGRLVTERSNVVLNAERTRDYHGRYFPLLMKLARKVQRKCGCSLKVAATVVSTLACQDDDGLYLFTYQGRIPGRWFWMRNVLRFSPWHHRGGTGRSNLMWHAYRPYMSRFGVRHGVSFKDGSKYKKFALMSDKEKAVRTASLRAFRQMILRAYQACISKAEEMNAGRFELIDLGKESNDGR